LSVAATPSGERKSFQGRQQRLPTRQTFSK